MSKLFKVLNLTQPILRKYCQELSIKCVFKKCEITPIIIPRAPCEELCVVYGNSEKKIGNGDELTPTQVVKPPRLSWNAENRDFHVVVMFDPDAPKRSKPIYRNWLHWLVGNIPGINLHRGCGLAEYVGAAPPKGTGIHRYIILVYKQETMLDFCERSIPNTCASDRTHFDICKFVCKYNLGVPIAGIVFHAKFDCSVLKTQKQLGIS